MGFLDFDANPQSLTHERFFVFFYSFSIFFFPVPKVYLRTFLHRRLLEVQEVKSHDRKEHRDSGAWKQFSKMVLCSQVLLPEICNSLISKFDFP